MQADNLRQMYKGPKKKKRHSEKHWAIGTIYDSENIYCIVFDMTPKISVSDIS